ncbi:MAG: hypothetical protein OEZ65_04400 [Gemmatimonadota bacterium]|nr:hypothetical protein [Gemmatimonadota bacterium]MDH5758806.1 hypothetical protein [Gemmatimonadota bacterium]
MKSGVTLAVVLAVLLLPGMAAGQGGDGYLFRRPVVSIGIRTGYATALAQSQIFNDLLLKDFTLQRSDFGAPVIGGEVAIRASDRLDVSLTVTAGASVANSEYVIFEGTDDLPIVQTTELSRTAVALGLKYYLRERGRRISRFAWIPTSWAPFVGGGVGRMGYSTVLEGEFVDTADPILPIYQDYLASKGSSPYLHLNGGVDVWLNKTLFLTAEGRYGAARAPLDQNVFGDFDDIDLSGLQFLVGLSVQF